MRRTITIVLALGVVGFSAMQLVPAPQQYRLAAQSIVDPKQSLDADASVPGNVKAIFKRACYDCHSETTVWPWYNRITPVSWYLAKHVKEGRDHLDFSEWSTVRDANGRVLHSSSRLESICDVVQDQSMPMPSYLLLHPSARLSKLDTETICRWAAK